MIAEGLRWREVRPPALVIGQPDKAALEDCWELGALLAAVLAP
jgi:hypothetical protein